MVNDESVSQEFNEGQVISYYFTRGFSFYEILLFLEKQHRHVISYSTLLRCLNQLGLHRRQKNADHTHFRRAYQRIEEIVNGPGSSGGYRAVWHTLKMEGTQVPRRFVQWSLKEIDPVGCELRRKHGIKRRQYINSGPNFAWYIDGYHRLKPWGFRIPGAIDGYSRKILWLKVTRTNNSPDMIESFYLQAIRKLGGCPVELITDLGTENGLAASMQCFFRENLDAHRYVASPRNQRIEGWWSQSARQRPNWWRQFFQDLVFRNEFDSTDNFQAEALWFAFSGLLQEELEFVKEHCNTHKTRKNRYGTVSGRPDALYYLPESFGGTLDLLNYVADRGYHYALEHIVGAEDENVYSEYFQYVMSELNVAYPNTWEEALELYQTLVEVNANGI